MAHQWKFFRAGGVEQVVLANAKDIANLKKLDQKLWVALACPTKNLEIDERMLTLLDTDKNGRIRVPEILAAIDWLKDSLKDLGELFEGSTKLPLESLAKDKAAGKELLAGAKLVLESLGKGDSDVVTLEDVSSTEEVFKATKLNGDGIIPVASGADDAMRLAIEDIIKVMGSVADRSGAPGIDQPKIDAFFDQAVLHADWFESGKTTTTRALGDATPDAAAAFAAVREKIDDYFTRCELVALDRRALTALTPSNEELVAISPHVLKPDSDEIAKLPLAAIEAHRALPLATGVNIAWATRIKTFADVVVAPLLGSAHTELTLAAWTTIKDKLAPFATWLTAQPKTDIATLGDARVVELARGKFRATLTALVAEDAALAEQSNQIEHLEKLIRLRRDFLPLLRNFVNFSTFYGREKAVFQAGTLYLDARSCDLCLWVEDMARHALLASKSEAYLVYLECTRKSDDTKRTLVAAVTNGDVDNIIVGRNGLFYDRAGADWDATITKIVENPISIRQAFWLPYKRFIRLVEETFAKRAKAADEESGKKVDTMAVSAGSAGAAPADEKKDEKKEGAPPGGKPMDIGTVAAIGVAVGGIATFFSSILATFFGLGMWMPVGVIALLLAISGPSMLIAWLKLRQRNIGPILDANGWAVNTMARVNVPFGAALTAVAKLPPGSSRSLADPFAEKKSPWRRYVAIALLVILAGAWGLGKLDAYLPEGAQTKTILHPPKPAASGSAAPSASAPPAK